MDRANGFYPFGREFESLQRGMARKKWRSWEANLPEAARRRLLEIKQEQVALRKAAYEAKKRERRAKMKL